MGEWDEAKIAALAVSSVGAVGGTIGALRITSERCVTYALNKYLEGECERLSVQVTERLDPRNIALMQGHCWGELFRARRRLNEELEHICSWRQRTFHPFHRNHRLIAVREELHSIIERLDSSIPRACDTAPTTSCTYQGISARFVIRRYSLASEERRVNTM